MDACTHKRSLLTPLGVLPGALRVATGSRPHTHPAAPRPRSGGPPEKSFSGNTRYMQVFKKAFPDSSCFIPGRILSPSVSLLRRDRYTRGARVGGGGAAVLYLSRFT